MCNCIDYDYIYNADDMILLVCDSSMFSLFASDDENPSGSPRVSGDVSLGAFCIQTPTMGPMDSSDHHPLGDETGILGHPRSELRDFDRLSAPKKSPALNPLFQSPVFTLATPLIGCAPSPSFGKSGALSELAYG